MDDTTSVRRQAQTLAPLERDAAAAWWAAAVEATEANEQRQRDADVALASALADPDTYAALVALDTDDPLVARERDLLVDMHVPYQVPDDLREQIIELQTSVGTRYAQHRGVVDGAPLADNALTEILRTSDDVGLRRRAWEASKTIGAEVASDVRELARLRNRAAREVGSRDHFALALATTAFDEARLFATLDAVDRLTAVPFAAWKAELDDRLAARFGCDPADLGPHHYADPFFQDVPPDAAVDLDGVLAGLDLRALTVRTFAGIGIDVAPIVARSDLEPRAQKNQHAFCLDLDRAGDIRVLSNNVPNAQWTETMLHEFGHAVYFAGVARDLPWTLRTMDMCLTEGVAMLFGRLARDPEWLATVAGVDGVDGMRAALADEHRASLLVFARWVLVMTHFEHGLYADPDGDHDTRWWDLVERYQLVRRPAGRRAPDWAAKLHVALAPVYYHNYLYGELFASQLQATLHGRFGGIVDRPAVGRFLVERLFARGASQRWDRIVEDVTGTPLSPDAFAAELAAISTGRHSGPEER